MEIDHTVAADFIRRWRASPLQFVLEAIFHIKEEDWKPWVPGTPRPSEKHIGPELWQGEFLRDVGEAITTGKRRFAVRAGHGVGKSTVEAWLILWFVLFWRPCKIPVTANSQDQLRDVVWAEVAHWHRVLPKFLSDMVEIKMERVEVKADRTQSFAVARTAREEKPEALQGFHSENLSFFVEEASGIPDIVFEVASGALSSDHSWVFMFGNPTRTSGYFHRAFHRNKHLWRTYHVPCQHSSRVDPNYAKQVEDEFGAESNVYRVRVLGEFPMSEDDAVIPLGLVEAAINRDVDESLSSVVWGLDVARFGGDETALAKRKGNALLEKVKFWRKLDLMQTVGAIVREYEDTPLHARPAAINVDVIGVGGGVVDRLRELGLPVRGVNVAESPSVDNKRYLRLRDELWFKARDWFASRAVTMPNDEKLQGELVEPKYGHESTGKLKVESKDEMKARGVRSPNLADAFCLTFAGGDHSSNARREERAVSYYDAFSYGVADDRVQYDPFEGAL